MVIALLGANGAGKSTLMRTISGLQPALAGAVSVCGTEIAACNARRRAQLITYVANEPGPAATISAYDYVGVGRYGHVGAFSQMSSEDIAAIEQALDDTNALSLVDRDVSRLSDGERQRVTLARSLAQRTPVILLDEPTAHLDVQQRDGLLKTLRNLVRRDRRVILVSTHDLHFAQAVSDHLLMLDRFGRLTLDTETGAVSIDELDRLFREDKMPEMETAVGRVPANRKRS